MDKPASLFTTHLRLLASLWLVAALAAVSLAQDGSGGAVGGEFVPEIPASYSGSGSFFNRQLGTAFRFGYHTKGYGTEEGVVTLGTMKVFSQEGSTIFLDGQATLSEDFGGGYNAGIGFRKLSDLGFGPDSKRINGLSFWSDGQSTSADNFFNQLGIAAESLGDSFDLRFQGNFPLERTQDGDLIEVLGSEPFFAGDALMESLQRFYRDTALTVLDLEGAKRIRDLDAWGFLSGYHLTGSGMDTTGYRAGVRGYAVPDVSVSLQVTDDDIYHTNVMFGITWFVGRTNRGNQPCGTLLDRFREPVLRNDYIATTQELLDNPIDPLTDAVSNEQFVFVHVDSDAPAGGDGTIENPYKTLAAAEAGSSDDNIVFVHSGSTLAGNFATKDGQRVLGEGLDPNGVLVEHFVNSAEQGLVILPETSAGSWSVTAPTIAGVGTVFDLDNHTSNEINNFVINNGVTAVAANLADSAHLANLDINTPTGDAISFTGVTGNSLIENSVTIDGAVGKGIFVDGGSGVLGANAKITDATGNAIEITGRTGGSVIVGEIEQILGGEGIYVHDNTGGTITFSSLANVSTSGADSAVMLVDNDGTAISFQELQATSGAADTFVASGGGTISVNDPNDSAFISNTGAGSALVVVGDDSFDGNPSLTILADVTNTGAGRVADIQDMTGGAVSVIGDVTDDTGTGSGILIEDNTGGTFSFAGATTLDTGGNSAVTLMNNDGAAINFSNLNASAAGADTFYVEGGGTIAVNDPNDTGLIVNTGIGSALVVRGDDTNGGGNPTVNIANDITNSGGGQAVDIQDMTGGGVTITGNVTDDDTLGSGILIEGNSEGTFAFQGVNTIVTGAGSAVKLKDNDGATITFDHLHATAGIGNAFDVEGGGKITVSDDPNNIGMIVNNGIGTAVKILGDDFVTATGDPNMSIAIDIMNTGGGMSVDIQDMTSSGVAFTGLINDTAGGVLVKDNTGGIILFTDLLTVNTGNNDAVALDNNTGATISFNGLDITASGVVKGFTATGGGDLTVTNTGETKILQSGAGTALELDGMTITAADAAFDTVNVTAGTAAGIILKDLDGTGTVTVGTGTDPGDGGTITTAGTGISVDNVADVAVNNVTVSNSTGNGVRVAGQGAGSSATFSDLTVSTSTGAAVTVANNTDGSITFNDLDATTTTTGNAVTVSGNSGGTATFNGVTADTTAGSGDALVVQNNTGGTSTFISADVDTTAGQGVALTNNTGASVSFQSVDVDTTTGAGFSASGGGTLTATGTNTIDTTTGIGLDLNGMTIGGSGAAFASVSVNGAANGILLTDLTGGQTRIGAATATGVDGDGGTLLSTNQAIRVMGVTNAVFNDVTVTSTATEAIAIDHTSPAASTVVFDNLQLVTSNPAANGIKVEDNGTGELDFTLRNSMVDVSAANTKGFVFNSGANTGEVDIRLQNNTITAADEEALDVNVVNGTGDVQFLLTGNTVENDSATNAAAEFIVTANRTLNATIGDQTGALPFDDNSFINSNIGGTAFTMETNGAVSSINLDLQDNIGFGGTADFVLTETNGTFGVVDRDVTFGTPSGNNNGDVDPGAGNVVGDFDDLLGPIKQVD